MYYNINLNKTLYDFFLYKSCHSIKIKLDVTYCDVFFTEFLYYQFSSMLQEKVYLVIN